MKAILAFFQSLKGIIRALINKFNSVYFILKIKKSVSVLYLHSFGNHMLISFLFANEGVPFLVIRNTLNFYVFCGLIVIWTKVDNHVINMQYDGVALAQFWSG
mmetsp:Transcript_2712/g.3840  ORF Transcript_2712/g.3840 Transcript_2712/m.3840 type:complete len:103 (+) Transcript_2712:1613-1921(+)